MSNASPKNKNNRAPIKDITKLDPREWIPVQYISTLFTKDILQAISNGQIDYVSLNVFVNAVRRSNNGPLNRFGTEYAQERVKHLIKCVEWCESGTIDPEPQDIMCAVYAYLYLNKETDPVKSLFLLQRWVIDQKIPVNSVNASRNDKSIIANDSMRCQLQEFLNSKKVEAIFIVMDRMIRFSRPRFEKRLIEVDPVGEVPAPTEINNASTDFEQIETQTLR